MKRLLMIGLAMLLLTGCADLQLIKNAALSELQSEAISVEMAAYRQTAVAPEPEVVPQPAVAKRQAEGLMRLKWKCRCETASKAVLTRATLRPNICRARRKISGRVRKPRMAVFRRTARMVCPSRRIGRDIKKKCSVP